MRGKVQRTTNEMWHLRALTCVPEHSVLGIGEKGVKGKRAKSLRTLKAVSSI